MRPDEPRTDAWVMDRYEQMTAEAGDRRLFGLPVSVRRILWPDAPPPAPDAINFPACPSCGSSEDTFALVDIPDRRTAPASSASPPTGRYGCLNCGDFTEPGPIPAADR